MLAAEHGFTGVVDVLLENKVDVQIANLNEIPPLWLAACHGREDIVRSMLAPRWRSLVDVDCTDLMNRTAL